MRQSRFVEHLDISLDDATYNSLAAPNQRSNNNMAVSNTPNMNPSLGLPAVPREMFHEASWRPMTIYNATENEMAGFDDIGENDDGADQNNAGNPYFDVETHTGPDHPPPNDPSETEDWEDEDLDVTAELQQETTTAALHRVNSFDFVLDRSAELAAETAAISETYGDAGANIVTRPTMAYTASSSAGTDGPFEEIELNDLSSRPRAPQQTPRPEVTTLKGRIWKFCLGVCDAYSEVVMKDEVSSR